MAEAAVATLKNSRRAPARRDWLRPLAFWALVVAGVAAALTAGAASRDIAWTQVAIEQANRAEAAAALAAEQSLAGLQAERAAAEAELSRDRARLAAMADGATHLRGDLTAGTLSLIEAGHTLRVMSLTPEHGLTTPGDRSLAAAALAALPVSEADQAALSASLVEGMTLHVY